jgi:probable rRNA maturation factor
MNRSNREEPLPRDFPLDLELQNSSDLVSSEETQHLEAWLIEVVSGVAPEAGSLGVRLTDDATMQEVNQRYRGYDKSTDVLSFSGAKFPEGPHLGDILISAQQAEFQARELGHSLFRELQTLLLHGLLHCLGYDHETDDGTMERLEGEFRGQWIDDSD